MGVHLTTLNNRLGAKPFQITIIESSVIAHFDRKYAMILTIAAKIASNLFKVV